MPALGHIMFDVGNFIVWQYGGGCEEFGVITDIFDANTLLPIRTWPEGADQATVQFPTWSGYVFLSHCRQYKEWLSDNGF